MGAPENSSKINEAMNDTLNDLLKFPLMEAIAGRRSRRFCLGAEIPDGVLAFNSKHKPVPIYHNGEQKTTVISDNQTSYGTDNKKRQLSF
jgi:hypothetical protein